MTRFIGRGVGVWDIWGRTVWIWDKGSKRIESWENENIQNNFGNEHPRVNHIQ